MLENLRYGTYIFFGLITFGGAAFIYFFFPETKGLSLEEMKDVFQGPWYSVARTAQRMSKRRQLSDLGDSNIKNATFDSKQRDSHSEKV